MHELSDTELVKKIRQGSEPAFREIYDRYHLQMYYIAKKYVKDPGLAEDAVQDIFVKFWEKRGSLDAAKSVRGYLFTMLKNHVLNMVRDRKTKIISFSREQEEKFACQQMPDDEVIYKEVEGIVNRGLEQLSDRKREIFELKVFSGHSNAEVAEKLGVSVRTVKTHYYNGSKFIKAWMKNHAGLLVFLVAIITYYMCE